MPQPAAFLFFDSTPPLHLLTFIDHHPHPHHNLSIERIERQHQSDVTSDRSNRSTLLKKSKQRSSGRGERPTLICEKLTNWGVRPRCILYLRLLTELADSELEKNKPREQTEVTAIVGCRVLNQRSFLPVVHLSHQAVFDCLLVLLYTTSPSPLSLLLYILARSPKELDPPRTAASYTGAWNLRSASDTHSRHSDSPEPPQTNPTMSSSIFFRFKSQKDPLQITFDGTSLSVFEVKRDIIALSKLGDGTDFDLEIYSADNTSESESTSHLH